MLRTIAPLVYYDRVDVAHIKIGTGSWQIWLTKNKSFRYESFWGSFTACQEHRGEQEIWIAYRHVKEEVRRADLGINKELTLEKLVDTAKKLTASDTTPWESRRETKKKYENYRNELEAISQAKEIEKTAIRQWCIFYKYPDGQVEFLGACWEKEQAHNRIQNIKKSAYFYESAGGRYDVPSGSYEIKQELVMPIDSRQKRAETNKRETKVTSQEVELLNQVAKLRQQLSELQNKLEQERRLNTNNPAAAKFIWN